MKRGFAACLAVAAAVAFAQGCGGQSASPSSPSSTTDVPITLPAGNSITYIGNAGFLIVVGGRKILIDSLYDGFPGGYSIPTAIAAPLLRGQAPLDGIELVLATHNHADHFTGRAVRTFLQNNARAVFLGPPDAAAELPGFGSRVIPADVGDSQRRSFEVGGIRVDAAYLSHGIPDSGPGVVNLGYIFTVGGLKFFHTGDIDSRIADTAYLARLGIPNEQVDIGFVEHFYLNTEAPDPWVSQGINGRRIVVQHYEYSTVPVDYTLIQRTWPTAVLFRQSGESWSIQ